MTLAHAVRSTPSQSPETFKSTEGRSYSYWRLRILYSTIIGYAAFYLLRQNFPTAVPALELEFGYSKTQIGWIMTAFSAVYGIGKFLNGYLSDRANARYFMAIGLLCCAVINFIMGFGSSLIFLIVFWSLNGWFQSMGWPPSARLLTHWFSPKELGTKWSLWSCSHQLGCAGGTALAAYLVQHYGWQSAFTVPSIIAVIGSLFILNRLRDNPAKVGLPEVEIYKNDHASITKDAAVKITIQDVINLVFKNKLVWYISIANLFLYIPRMGVLNWAPTFLKELKGVSLIVAGGQVACFDIAGLVGGIAAGWFSDRVFGGRRGPVGTIYLLLLSIAFLLLWKVPAGHPWVDTVSLMLAGFLIAGPQVLVGIALADFASKRAVGVATGLAGVMGYMVGAAISGAGIGRIVDNWGWEGAFLVFVGCALVGAFFFSLTWNARAAGINDNFKTSNLSTK
jgi:OPA family glycerol-3-phosphate transporter-like MFS transporter